MSQETNITKPQSNVPERVRQRAVVIPPVDIFESKEELLVVADVPGAGPEGLNIHFDKDQLFIDASTQAMGEDQKPLFREFGPLDYKRVFELAPGIDIEKISAELKNGVLKIHLPKSTALKPRKIQIHVD